MEGGVNSRHQALRRRLFVPCCSIDLTGQKEGKKFTAQAVFDHVGDNNKDSVALQANGFDVAKINQGTGASFLASGLGGVELAVSLLGDKNIGGQMSATFTHLKFNDADLLSQVGIQDAAQVSGGDQLKARFITDVARAVEKMPQVQVVAQIFGTWTDPSLKLSSNMSAVLAGVVKSSVGSLVQDQRKELEARLDAVVKQKAGDIQAKTAGLDEKLNGKFSGIEAKIQEKISEASGINLGGGDSGSPIKVPSLDKLFKK